jgi:hypothetical protein
MAKFLQFTAQLLVVINFAVEDDGDIAIFRQNRLVAGTEVDNLEPRGAHRQEAGFEHTLLVRATMKQRGDGPPNAIRVRCPMLVREADDSTQLTAPLLLALFKSAFGFYRK